MTIEWIPIFSAALKGVATGSTTRAAGLLIEKVKGRVFLSELELALDEAQKRDDKLVASQHHSSQV